MAAFSLSRHMAERGVEGGRERDLLSFSFYKATILLDSDPAFMTSFNLNYS